jgi:hypothetical protein
MFKRFEAIILNLKLTRDTYGSIFLNYMKQLSNTSMIALLYLY